MHVRPTLLLLRWSLRRLQDAYLAPLARAMEHVALPKPRCNPCAVVAHQPERRIDSDGRPLDRNVNGISQRRSGKRGWDIYTWDPFAFSTVSTTTVATIHQHGFRWKRKGEGSRSQLARRILDRSHLRIPAQTDRMQG
ncbi:hypothetical protein V2G26_019717 [Clonostachys chloroleuca]